MLVLGLWGNQGNKKKNLVCTKFSIKQFYLNELNAILSSILPSEVSAQAKQLLANKPFDHQSDFAAPVTKRPRVVCLPGLLPGIFTLCVGKLILGAASRLDAFSASPFWT